MSQIQERYLQSGDGGYYGNNYANEEGYDNRDYDTRYGGGYSGGYAGGYGGSYRGHQRPILIIQPPTQPPVDPLLQGLTSLIPLAYLLPLALLAASSVNPTTTVVGRKKRSAYLGKESHHLPTMLYRVSIPVDASLGKMMTQWSLVSQCPERGT